MVPSKGHSKKADGQYTTSLMIKFHEENNQEKHVQKGTLGNGNGQKKGSEKYWARTNTYLNIWLNQYWLYPPPFNPQSLWFVVSDPILSAAKSRQSCPTLCGPIDGSPPGFAIPGILQARTLEWVAISFSNAWKWKVKVKLLSHVRLLATPWTAAYQAPPSMEFTRQAYWSGVPLPSPLSIV